MHVAPFCAGCGQSIFDQYFLCVCTTERCDEPGQAWHCRCLTCSVCGVTLDPAAGAPLTDLVTGHPPARTDDNDLQNGKENPRARTVCYYRDGLLFCRDDYQRHMGDNGTWRRCTSCKCPVSKDEMVMKVDRFVYHLPCFRCSVCGQILRTGDEFGMREAGLVCCRHHCNGQQAQQPLAACFNLIHPSTTFSGSPSHLLPDPTLTLQAHGQYHDKDLLTEQILRVNQYTDLTHLTPSKKRLSPKTKQRRKKGSQSYDREGLNMLHLPNSPDSASGNLETDSLVSPTNNDSTMTMHLSNNHHMSQMRMGRDSGSPNSTLGGTPSQSGQTRTKRMRTSFKHQQLRAMKQYFSINHNPDAKDLKQLAQKTGLTKRVLQVWFQNARAKYRRSLLKQEGLSGPVSVPPGESPSRSDHSPSNEARCQDAHAQSPCSCSSSFVSAAGDCSVKEMDTNDTSGESIFAEALAQTDYY